MKTMTCRALGGPCGVEHRGESADDVIKAQDRHLKEAVQAGDATHQEARDAMKGRWRHPKKGYGLVPRHQRNLRRPAWHRWHSFLTPLNTVKVPRDDRWILRSWQQQWADLLDCSERTWERREHHDRTR